MPLGPSAAEGQRRGRPAKGMGSGLARKCVHRYLPEPTEGRRVAAHEGALLELCREAQQTASSRLCTMAGGTRALGRRRRIVVRGGGGHCDLINFFD